jgi:hypothetical protein
MKLSQSLGSQASDRRYSHDPLSDHPVIEDRFNVIMLPHGVRNERELWVRHLYIRELNGYDEQFLARIIADGSFYLHEIVTELLARVISLPVRKKGSLSSSLSSKTSEDMLLAGVRRKEKMVAEMTIGDRVALLLHLRKISFGDLARTEVRCPACQEQISSDLAISELVKQMQVQPEVEYYNIEVDEYSIWARLPCGRDQDLITQVESDAENAATNTLTTSTTNTTIPPDIDYTRQIVKMCVNRSTPDLPKDLPDDLVQKISTKLEPLDPLANINLNMVCPVCNHSFKMPFFVEQFLFQELMMRQLQLDQEIHWLAFYYNWSEHEILSLPITRRKRYVGLIADELSSSSNSLSEGT